MSPENNDDLLSKYTNPSGPIDVSVPVDPDDETVSGCLTVLPASVAMMLDLRFRNGNRLAVPYGYITRMAFDPSKMIEVHTTELVFRIMGRNLLPIYSAMTSHTAKAVSESASKFDEGEDEPFVESITIDTPKE